MVGDILQPTHLLFVLVVALLVLGPKRLPEVGRTLGSGIRDFRAAINGESTESREERPEPEYVHAPPNPPLPGAQEAAAEHISEPAVVTVDEPEPVQNAAANPVAIHEPTPAPEFEEIRLGEHPAEPTA